MGEVEEMEIGSGGGGGMEEFDDSDDDDDDDNDDGAQPAECIPPSGFSIVKDIPPAETLTLGSPLHKALVGQHLLYRWPLVGWCYGVIHVANTDRRRKVHGNLVNVVAHYEIDGSHGNHFLEMSMYGVWSRRNLGLGATGTGCR